MLLLPAKILHINGWKEEDIQLACVTIILHVVSVQKETLRNK
jgi:hypothetical protein